MRLSQAFLCDDLGCQWINEQPNQCEKCAGSALTSIQKLLEGAEGRYVERDQEVVRQEVSVG